jgi:hypothetical protein
MRRLMIGLLAATSLSLSAAQATLAWPDDAQAALSTSPAGTTAGGTWTVDVSFVSQGHILRVDNLHPSIAIRNVVTGERRSFSTQTTAESGVWRGVVTFPSEGSWTYSVIVGGSGLTFDYPPVSIGPAPVAAAPPSTGPVSPLAVPALLALLAAAAVAAAGGLILARRSMRRSATAVVEHVASADRR